MAETGSPDLTNTSRVILGLLRISGERTGYEIKSLVDNTTEFFWPASYGRIYPELHRLEEIGLVKSRAEPRGDRPRKLYALTAAGERALEEWLRNSERELTFELRDEGLLRFFFADAVPADVALANLRAMRAHHERAVRRLRELEPFARETQPLEFPLLTLEAGIELHSWYVEQCSRLERHVERKRTQAPERAPGGRP